MTKAALFCLIFGVFAGVCLLCSGLSFLSNLDNSDMGAKLLIAAGVFYTLRICITEIYRWKGE